MLDSLLYTIDQCGMTLFGILLSTNTFLSQVSLPKDIVISNRERLAGHNVRHAPFVHLAFDNWREDVIISEDKMTLSDVCSLWFLARFGRPL